MTSFFVGQIKRMIYDLIFWRAATEDELLNLDFCGADTEDELIYCRADTNEELMYLEFL